MPEGRRFSYSVSRFQWVSVGPHPVIKLESGYLFKMMRALFKHINTDFYLVI